MLDARNRGRMGVQQYCTERSSALFQALSKFTNFAISQTDEYVRTASFPNCFALESVWVTKNTFFNLFISPSFQCCTVADAEQRQLEKVLCRSKECIGDGKIMKLSIREPPKSAS